MEQTVNSVFYVEALRVYEMHFSRKGWTIQKIFDPAP
jgi:hypothetical protein